MKKEPRLAHGKTCDLCKRRNHFRGSEMCKPSVHLVHDDSDDSYYSISCVTAEFHTILSSDSSTIYCIMRLNQQDIKMQIDCCATVNILPKSYINNNGILPESVTPRMWNGVNMKTLGKCQVKTINRATGGKFNVHYMIVDQYEFTPLLSRKASEVTKIMTVNYG
ncbi:hypothetical protein LSH36_242g00024 [Paralvinella palmiformis]|uniref:Uncharacterized protein n=1 Tax=Paralvinella palmiformis TaxID=53620 RepID=A0AAD9JMB2_9ANNE|nr:hypothetical protein LSH36_242g00024 [Paralvinella palmiformis]